MPFTKNTRTTKVSRKNLKELNDFAKFNSKDKKNYVVKDEAELEIGLKFWIGKIFGLGTARTTRVEM